MGKPKAPDYAGAAAAQGEANREVVRDQTFANRPDQITPWGYSTWNPYQTTDPATGEATTAWENVTGLTPELQDILNKNIAVQSGRADIAGMMTGRLGNEFGTAMNWEGFSPLAETPQGQFTMPENVQRGLDFSSAPEIGDPERIRSRAEEAIYGKARSRLDDRFGGMRNQLEIKMRNQGLAPGDEAWQSQVQNLERQANDAYGQAQMDAVVGGRGEAAQMFGQDVTRRGVATGETAQQGQFANQAGAQAFGQALGANAQNYGMAMQNANYANALRQQQIGEEQQRRGQSLNEINALMSGQQVGMPQMPNFSNAGAAQPAPIYQAAADQGSYNAAMNPFGAILDAGSTIGAAYLGR